MEYLENVVVVVIMAGTRENFYDQLKLYMRKVWFSNNSTIFAKCVSKAYCVARDYDMTKIKELKNIIAGEFARQYKSYEFADVCKKYNITTAIKNRHF